MDNMKLFKWKTNNLQNIISFFVFSKKEHKKKTNNLFL